MLRTLPRAGMAIVIGAGIGNPLMASAPTAETPSGTDPCCAVVELRQYTLWPGKRDVLVELFDREFVEAQEALGMTIIGQFRDLDRPDYFVWLRGFPDMPARATSLAAFYGGPAWKAHSKEANGTMIDSDNVLLLAPASPQTAFVPPDRLAKDASSADADAGLIVATIYYPRREAMAGFPGFFGHDVRPLVSSSGASIVAEYVTSASPNNFPPLPVREGEMAFVWFARLKSANAFEQHRKSLEANAEWRSRVAPALEAQLAKPTETLRLAPTLRSRLRA